MANSPKAPIPIQLWRDWKWSFPCMFLSSIMAINANAAKPPATRLIPMWIIFRGNFLRWGKILNITSPERKIVFGCIPSHSRYHTKIVGFWYNFIKIFRDDWFYMHLPWLKKYIMPMIMKVGCQENCLLGSDLQLKPPLCLKIQTSVSTDTRTPRTCEAQNTCIRIPLIPCWSVKINLMDTMTTIKSSFLWFYTINRRFVAVFLIYIYIYPHSDADPSAVQICEWISRILLYGGGISTGRSTYQAHIIGTYLADFIGKLFSKSWSCVNLGNMLETISYKI